MKKYVSLLAVAALICVLFAASCKQDPGDEPHAGTAFLEGTWASERNGAYTFNIEADLAFVCVLRTDAIYARIKGNLDDKASALGPNDYLLRNLEALETIEDATHPGNVTVEGALGTMNGIVVTLIPKENNTRFTFTSPGTTGPAVLAQTFFGSDGDFIKQP